MSAALAFDGVTCVRGRRTLFEAESFALAPGDALLVSGPNGVGKSSLVRIAAGLLRSAAGTVTVAGRRAMLGETIALDGDRPLARALDFWARLDGRPGAVGGALALFDLAPLADIPVRLLSTGQRKRAGLARVAASGAEIWLLDEPANGLDGAAVALLESAIAAHRADGGIAVIATHQRIALDAAQHIALGSAA